MDILVATIWTALALFLLYETSAVFSYLSLPVLKPLNYFTKIDEYKNALKNGYSVQYSEYMETKYSGFFVKLFSCRYCFGFWLALISSYIIGEIFWLPAVYFGGQLICSGFKKVNNWMVSHD
jgi:hypothetical protein